MSVLMNSSRSKAKELLAKKMKAKAEAARAKSMEQERCRTAEPPMSSTSTIVWHWDHDTVRITLMYDNEKNKVWCNGYELEITESFDDPHATGGVISFVIYIQKHSDMHQGKICRMLAAGDNPFGYLYVLYVDGLMIPEHRSSGVSAVIKSGASHVESPPSYQASVSSNGTSCVDREKTKMSLPWMLSALRMKKE